MRRHSWIIRRRSLVLLVAVTCLAVETAKGQEAFSHYYGEKLVSRYDARALPAFEVGPPLSPEQARTSLVVSLEQVRGALSDKDIDLIRRVAEQRERLWTGRLPSDEEIEFRFNLARGRLDIINHRVHGLRPGHRDVVVKTQPAAEALARRIIETIAERGWVEPGQIDFSKLEVSMQKTGSGQLGQPLNRRNEVIIDYRITAKRVLNGVPVIGGFVRVVVHRSGSIAELNVSHCPLRLEWDGSQWIPRGRGKPVPIDLSADEARARMEAAMQLKDDTRLHVERWGLAYVDSGKEAFLQPAYVFLVTPLTKTKHGIIAARKSVRVIAASGRALEPIPFDPLHVRPRAAPAGDARPSKPK